MIFSSSAFLKTTAIALAALALSIPAGGDALAKNDKAKGKPAHAGPAKAGNGNAKGSAASSGNNDLGDAATGAVLGAVVSDILLGDDNRRVITEYYQTHSVSAKPLPPGIAKNLARGKPLPPGIAKTRVPGALSSRVSIPSGYTLQQVGTDVLLVEVGTRIIADILRDVIRS